MGNIIHFSDLYAPSHSSAIMAPLFFVQKLPLNAQTLSVNVPMAKMLAEITPNRRARLMEQCLLKILREHPDDYAIRDFDVMFHPFYRIDALKIMISACKVRPFSVLWPGTYQNGKLIYAREGDLDYHVFNVRDYDITCVI